jgi:probable rRNA maturation factor
LLRASGNACGVGDRAGLTLRLTGDDELARLNLDFMGVDAPTDVLAFPSGETGYVGDIAISVERAASQSPGAVADELRLLAVHGLLHCLGHDHDTTAAARRMTGETRRLLPDQRVPELLASTPETP